MTCHYCDKPATHYCDFVIEAAATTDKPMPPRDGDEDCKKLTEWLLNPTEVRVETCDRPLCDDHRVQSGNVFWDGESERFIDSVDYCPGHAGIGSHKPPFNPVRSKRGKAG